MPKVAKCAYPKPTVEEFVERHGEAMKQCDVAKLIGFTRTAVCLMCKDGRLDTTEAKTVLTRSLWAYLFRRRAMQ